MNKSELKRDLSEAIEFFKSELTKIRTGRATPSLIEDLTLEVYGSKMRLKELGSITVPESQMIVGIDPRYLQFQRQLTPQT